MAEQVFPVTVKAKPKPKQPTLLEALMAAGSSAYQGANQYAQEAAADPVNQIGFAGPIGNRLIREMGAGQVKQLIDDKLGYEPAKRAFGDASTLLDILSGKEKSVPFAPAYAGQKATDAALNAGQAGLDVATVLPFVPKMPKGASPSPMGKPYSFGGVANDFLPDSQLSMGFGSSGKDGQRSLAQIIGDAIKGKGPPGAVTNAVEDQAPPGAFFAYHGSPHDFDRFDLSKIGTGEGAQAYGRGLYFAESPKTGQAYRDAMLFDAIQGVKDPARREAALVLHRNNWDVAAAQKELGRNATPEQVKMLSDVAENPPGGLYKVKIDADANAFKEFEAPPTEAEIEAMKKAGIPGLKYFDNGSRASEQGTRNYVVFDDNLVNIIAKNGKPFAPRNPLDQFTPPTSIDDIFTGGAPRGPRELSGGPTNPAGLDGSAFNLNTPEVPYDPARGFGGLDAKFAADKNAKTLSEALAKRAKPPGYDDWSPEWRAAYDKGLDMSQEARMARAREQGFNVDERLYHGTGADFPAFDKAKFGSNYGFDKDSKMAAFFTTDPEVAGSYANTSADQLTRKRLKANPEYRRIEDEYIKGLSGGGYEGASARLKAMRQSEKSGDQIIPVFARGNYLESDMGGARYSADAYHDALSKASNQKLNGARFNYVADGADMTKPSDVVGIFDPANIRSTSAAFDPANAGKPTLLGMGAPFEGKVGMGFPFGNDWKPLAENLKATINTGDRNALAQQMAQLESMSKGDVVNVAKSIEGYTPKSKVEAIEYIKERFEDAAQRARKNATINRMNVNSMKQGLDSYLKSFGIDESFGPPPPKDPTKLGAGSPADSDLIKLLMAYGAFGGMSAGALATMDAQKHQKGGF